MTALGCIGVDCGQHRQFCSENGLDIELASSQVWLTWLEQYLSSNLQQAQSSLESLLHYVSMHGVKKTSVQEAFLHFDGVQVYQALRHKLERAQSQLEQKAWSEILVKICPIFFMAPIPNCFIVKLKQKSISITCRKKL